MHLKKLQAAASSFTRDRLQWQVVITMGKETVPSHLTIAKSYPNTTEIAKCTDVSSQYSEEFWNKSVSFLSIFLSVWKNTEKKFVKDDWENTRGRTQ